jgi:hypothetical protein
MAVPLRSEPRRYQVINFKAGHEFALHPRGDLVDLCGTMMLGIDNDARARNDRTTDPQILGLRTGAAPSR